MTTQTVQSTVITVQSVGGGAEYRLTQRQYEEQIMTNPRFAREYTVVDPDSSDYRPICSACGTQVAKASVDRWRRCVTCQTWCFGCKQLVERHEALVVFSVNRSEQWCRKCVRASPLVQCVSCARYYIPTDESTCECGLSLCPFHRAPRDHNCRAAAEAGTLIHAYHYKPRPIFHGRSLVGRATTHATRYFGIEMEVDVPDSVQPPTNGRQAGLVEWSMERAEPLPPGNARTLGDDLRSAVSSWTALPPPRREAFPRSDAEFLLSFSNNQRLYYLKPDSSLLRGIEIVSHPATLAYHMEEFPWSAIGRCAESLGLDADKSSRCGLHIHVNRSSFAPYAWKPYYSTIHTAETIVLYKLTLMYARVWDSIVKFAGRTEDAWRAYAKPPNFGNYKPSPRTLSTANSVRNTRHSAINDQNNTTIEFRIFGGTQRPEVLFAYLQCVDGMLAMAAEWNFPRISKSFTWLDVVQSIKGREFQALCKERGVTA